VTITYDGGGREISGEGDGGDLGSLDRLCQRKPISKRKAYDIIQRLAEAQRVPLVKIKQPLQFASAGKTVTPPIDEVMAILGRAKVIERLQRAVEVYWNDSKAQETCEAEVHSR